jgi:myo-inositol-1(or 4)-monophosphatase
MIKPWNTALETGLAAIKLASDRLVAPRGRASAVVQKVNSAFAGSTRAIDRDIEEYIVANLNRAHFAVLSEESGFLCPPGMEYFAVVDPIDGTDMALRGLEFFAVCIACGPLENGRIYLKNIDFSTVCSPKGVFAALKGHGATLDGETIRASAIHDVRQSIIRLPPHRPLACPLLRHAKSYLYLGSSALEICAVAQGTLDAYVEPKRRKVFDYAAAGFIAMEAGARVATLGGLPLPGGRVGPVSRSTLLVAANDRLFEQIHRALASETSLRSS